MKAIDVANWFVAKANSEDLGDGNSEGITNLKLQKMLYFAQAAYLSLNGNKPLFADDFKAWDFGPVIEDIYHSFKQSKNQPIDKPTNADYVKAVSADTVEFLESVWSVFGKFSAAKLVQMSHEHQPWRDANANTDKTITKQKIYEYYKTAFKQV